MFIDANVVHILFCLAQITLNNFEFLWPSKVYFERRFDFLIFGVNNLKFRLFGGKNLRFSKMFFEIWGANISKNNKRGALAFLGLILIDLLRNIEFTKNVEGNILEIVNLEIQKSCMFSVISFFFRWWLHKFSRAKIFIANIVHI